MAEQFTEKFKDGRNILRFGIENIHHVGFGQFYAGEAIDKLAEYETAEEEGRLVVLPCSPKDTLYFLVDDCDYPNDCGQNRTCNRCEYRNLHVEKDTLSQTTIVASLRLFGKTIFLTKEEAEKALEEMKK